jgi:hypothetical protein
MGIVTDRQHLGIFEIPLAIQTVYFIDEHIGVQHHAVAYGAETLRMQNSGGYQMQNRLPITYDHRVTGIGAALEADDRIHGRCKQINYSTFSFVTPLGTDHYGCLGHILPFQFES